MPQPSGNSRLQAQTAQEWVYEFSLGEAVWPAAWGDPSAGYISMPSDFNPKFKPAAARKVKKRIRVRYRP